MENADIAKQTENTNNDDKTIGILSYLGVLWVVAYIMYGNKKSEYNAFHVREGLGVIILFVALIVIVSVLSFIKLSLIAWIINLVAYPIIGVLCIIGIINAVNGDMKPLPIISENFTQKVLKNFK